MTHAQKEREQLAYSFGWRLANVVDDPKTVSHVACQYAMTHYNGKQPSEQDKLIVKLLAGWREHREHVKSLERKRPDTDKLAACIGIA